MAISKDYLQTEVGTQMAQVTKNALPEIKKFVAITRPLNQTSMKFFESIGLKRSPYMHEDYDPLKYAGFELIND